MSERFDNKLILELKVSYVLVGVVTAIHVGAAVIVAAVPLDWMVRSILWVALAVSLYITLRAHAVRPTGAVTGVELDGDGSWAVQFSGDTTWHPCRLVGCSVHLYIVVLRLRPEGARRTTHVIVTADSVPADPFRRLRARLRLERATA